MRWKQWYQLKWKPTAILRYYDNASFVFNRSEYFTELFIRKVTRCYKCGFFIKKKSRSKPVLPITNSNVLMCIANIDGRDWDAKIVYLPTCLFLILTLRWMGSGGVRIVSLTLRKILLNYWKTVQNLNVWKKSDHDQSALSFGSLINLRWRLSFSILMFQKEKKY